MPRRSSVLMMMQGDHWMQSWHWDFCCCSQWNSPVQVQPEAGGVVQCWALVSALPECRMPRQATSSGLGNFSSMLCGSCDKGFACKDLLWMPCLMGFFSASCFLDFFFLTLFAGYGAGSYTRKTKRGVSGWGKMHRPFSTVITGNCFSHGIWNQMVW